MAIKIYEQFAPFANPADGDYPHGSFKNDSIPGAEDGTPLDAVWANDYAGTDAELFAQAGIVPSGQPDKLGASQRLEALKIVARKHLELKIFQSPTDNLTEVSTFTGGVGVVYEVRKTSDDSLATIYSDAAGTTEIVQNGTSNVSDSAGVVEFYIADGDYSVEVNSVQRNFSVNVLRQDLANPDKGAAMVAYRGGGVSEALDKRIIFVGSVAELEGLPAPSEGMQAEVRGTSFEYIGTEWKPISAVSIKSFGAVGDGSTDDTLAIKDAVDYSGEKGVALYAPAGEYLCTDNIEYGAGFVLYGDGPALTVFIKDFASGAAKGMFWCDTESEESQIAGPNFSDFTIDGKVEEFGFGEQYHLLSMSGVKDAVVRNVHFMGNTGDGIYIGSGASGGLIRHNTNIVVDSCVFDGRINSGRNGLSVIDCDGITVTKCFFSRTSASRMPGAIDFERNSFDSVHKNAKIIGCTFKDLFEDNVNGVMFSINQSDAIEPKVTDLVIYGCTFDKVYTGVNTPGITSERSPYAPNDSVVVRDNYFIDCLNVLSLASDGVLVSGNTFAARESSTTYRNRILLGIRNRAKDITLENNTFKFSNSTGVLEIRDVDGLTVKGNVFEDCVAACLYFTNVGGATINRLRVQENVFRNPSRFGGGVTTLYVFNAASGINSSGNNMLINSTCLYRDNIIEDGIKMNPGGWTTYFPGSSLSSGVTAGTWDEGNAIFASGGSLSSGNYARVCSKGGTFGTLFGVTADADSGSTILTNISDPSAFRIGQWIIVGDDTSARKILDIRGSEVELDSNYSGTSGTAVSVGWSAPVFVVV